MESGDDSARLWDCRIQQLKEWRAAHGDCAVPKAAGLLGRWTSRQRELAKKGRLTQVRINTLDELGFVWDANDSAWNAQYETLRLFHEKHGHSCVPSVFPVLGIWVAKQRGKARNSKLTPERIARLNQVNFVWSPAEAEWLCRYSQLQSFHQRHGHCSVPIKGGDLERLGWWANTQRQNFRKGKLSREREHRLNLLNFVWKPQSGGRLGHTTVEDASSDNPSSSGLAASAEENAPIYEAQSTEAGARRRRLRRPWEDDSSTTASPHALRKVRNTRTSPRWAVGSPPDDAERVEIAETRLASTRSQSYTAPEKTILHSPNSSIATRWVSSPALPRLPPARTLLALSGNAEWR